MTATSVAPASVSVVLACTHCAQQRARAVRAEIDRDQALRLVQDMQTRLDAERRHSADLERQLQQHTPTWEPA